MPSASRARMCLFALGGLLAMTVRGGEAATVRAYALPAGTTIDPQSKTRAITIARDGTIAALVSTIGEPGPYAGVRWRDGVRTIFAPLGERPNPLSKTAVPSHLENIVASPGAAYVTVGFAFSGAYSGDITQVQRWTGLGASQWLRPACVASGDEEDEQSYGADEAGQLALTMDITGAGSFLVMTDDVGTYAPYAYIVSHGTCRFLGRAVVRAVRGRYAAGVRGFVNGHLAATNVPGQRFTAVRWVDTRMSELGDGFPFAINANGLTVGASRRPGPVNEVRGGSIEMQPTELEALAWDPAGRRIALVDRASSSIAYDVADDGTIVGTLTAQDGKHYAFRYRDGKLERLDDMPHPEGWRFESAYAIANDGSILGIGTRNGIATIFRWYATGGPT